MRQLQHDLNIGGGLMFFFCIFFNVVKVHALD